MLMTEHEEECLHNNRIIDPLASGNLGTWYWVCSDCGKVFGRVENTLPQCPFHRRDTGGGMTRTVRCALVKEDPEGLVPCVVLLTSGRCPQCSALKNVVKWTLEEDE